MVVRNDRHSVIAYGAGNTGSNPVPLTEIRGSSSGQDA